MKEAAARSVRAEGGGNGIYELKGGYAIAGYMKSREEEIGEPWVSDVQCTHCVAKAKARVLASSSAPELNKNVLEVFQFGTAEFAAVTLAGVGLTVAASPGLPPLLSRRALFSPSVDSTALVQDPGSVQ